ncbi:MAG: ROK family protein, partial [Planctomycetales bacterium]|nr:ROK family protein [Planctomycetales bacterium]
MKNHDRTTTIREAKLPLYAGIDVGGTSIKLGLVDDQGLTLSRTQFPTESEKGVPNAIERTAHVLWSELKRLEADQAQLAAVGLATPGTMDVAAGMILDPPNLPGWRHFPIVAELQQALGKPVAFANDANAAAFGESWIGRGREFPSLIMLTLGTGVGGGIIIGDLSIDGEHSHGSECGHLIIDHNEDARMCPCGQRGHLEAYASATALIRRA